jgi:hypothetical protein
MTASESPSPKADPPPHVRGDRGRARQRLATGLQALALLAAITLFLAVAHHHYPIQHWLFWRYLGVGVLAGLWAASCASFGCFVLARTGVAACRRASDLVLAFPVGVLAFELAIFLLGLGGLLGTALFILLPLAFAASGADRLYEAVHGWARATRVRSQRELAVTVFGLGGIGLLYFQILSPAPFSWDALWYHLPIARNYALRGAVGASPEGWWLAAYPHGASLVYTWAFLLPVGQLWDKLELCAHIEFAVFLATIASIPTLVRTFVPDASARLTWVSIFLFPGIFLYDGNLNCGADHMAAVWSIPLVLTLMRVWRTWAVRDAVLFGAFAGAALLAKYSAWAMLFLPGILFVVRAGWLAWRRVRGSDRPVLATFAAGATTILLTSAPHWLKNWIWYGDPVYPILYKHLHVHPWQPDSAASFRTFVSFTFPPAPGWQGVKDALLNTITFSFLPNDWWSFHRDVPVFGSLFTLTTLFLFFVRAKLRLWLTYLGVMLAFVAWYLTNHQDRYVQAWLPVMAGASMATLMLLWRGGRPLVRALVVVLVSAQIVWGGDVPFFPTHNLTYDSAFRIHANFLASGFMHTPHRLRVGGPLGEVGESLPPDARLLLHELQLQTGLGVQTVSDTWQGRISYATLRAPAAIYKEFSDLGITHLIWVTASESGWSSIASDLAFASFALNYGQDPATIDRYTVARMPHESPEADFNDQVALLTCHGPYRAGWYSLGQLVVPEPGQAWATPRAPIDDVSAAIERAGFLVVDPDCYANLSSNIVAEFQPPFEREKQRLYVRRVHR